MKKAIILTIYDPNPNMGNRLQNYAVQRVIEKENCEVTSVSFAEISRKWRLKGFINGITNYRFTKNPLYWKKNYQMYREFARFNKTFIKTRKVHSMKQIPKADYYILGSDQIWNPFWWAEHDSRVQQMEKEVYLASFAPPEKIVCISPSFGGDDILEGWKPWFKKQLSRIPEICVREEAGKQIVRDLTGKEAVVTIDPTLMLTREEWDVISEKPEGFDENEPYILTYFLGETSEQAEKELELYSEQLNAKIYRLFDDSCEEMYGANPSHFVYLIKHAALIMTDSFHACVFSFIYGKPFLVYDRVGGPEMMSRMDTLFNKFDLKRKYVGSGLQNDVLECNYTNGYSVLKKEQEKLRTFIVRQMERADKE